MVPQTFTYKPQLTYNIFVRAFTDLIDALVKRIAFNKSLFSSIGLLLVGLSIPFIMVLEVIPAMIFLGFVATALIIAGGIRVLYYL